MLPKLPQFTLGIGEVYNVMCAIRDLMAQGYEVTKPSSHNWAIRITTADAYREITLPMIAKRFEIITHDNAVTIKRTPIKGDQYDEPYTVDGGGYYTYNSWTAQIALASGVAGTPADVTLVTWD